MKYLVQILFILQFIFLNNLPVYSQSWVLDTVYTEINGSSASMFGYTLAVHKNTAVMGSPIHSYQDDSIDRKARGTSYILQLNEKVGIAKTSIVIPIKWEEGLEFGRSVSISDGFLVIAAPLETLKDSTVVEGTGCVYVYERDSLGNWIEFQKLFGDPSMISARSGWVTSTSDSFIFISSNSVRLLNRPFYEPWEGGVFVFKRDKKDWKQESIITHPGEYPKYTLGVSCIETVGNDILIGSAGDPFDLDGEDSMRSSGAVHRFIRKNGSWEYSEKVISNSRKEGALFGRSVSANEQWMAVGAPHADFSSSKRVTGAVELFRKNSSDKWEFHSTLFSPDPTNAGYFGINTDIYGNRLLVGSHKGAFMYLFDGNEWKISKAFLPNEIQKDDQYGHNVVYDGSRVFVTAPKRELEGNMKKGGALFLYRYGWPLHAPSCNENSSFSIFPNPTSSEVTVSGINTDHINHIIVLSPLGKIVYEENCNQITDLDVLLDGVPGVYTIVLSQDQGEQVVKKVVKVPSK